MVIKKLEKQLKNLHKYQFHYNKEDHFVYVGDEQSKSLEIKSPFLKVLKPHHSIDSRRRNTKKNYLLLEVNNDMHDYDEESQDFMYVINKVHEVSQEKIRVHAKDWFRKELDIDELDILVRRPIENNNRLTYIKILFPYDEDIEERTFKLGKGEYVSCNISFIGLRIGRESITEEWQMTDLITQEDVDYNIEEYIYEKTSKKDLVQEAIIEQFIQPELKEEHEKSIPETKEELQEEHVNIQEEKVVSEEEVLSQDAIKTVGECLRKANISVNQQVNESEEVGGNDEDYIEIISLPDQSIENNLSVEKHVSIQEDEVSERKERKHRKKESEEQKDFVMKMKRKIRFSRNAKQTPLSKKSDE